MPTVLLKRFPKKQMTELFGHSINAQPNKKKRLFELKERFFVEKQITDDVGTCGKKISDINLSAYKFLSSLSVSSHSHESTPSSDSDSVTYFIDINYTVIGIDAEQRVHKTVTITALVTADDSVNKKSLYSAVTYYIIGNIEPNINISMEIKKILKLEPNDIGGLRMIRNPTVKELGKCKLLIDMRNHSHSWKY